jgi:hypothetical protein
LLWVDAYLLHVTTKDLTGLANEAATLLVLLLAGGLANGHDPRVRRAVAIDYFESVLGERAALAV